MLALLIPGLDSELQDGFANPTSRTSGSVSNKSFQMCHLPVEFYTIYMKIYIYVEKPWYGPSIVSFHGHITYLKVDKHQLDWSLELLL